MTLRIGNGKTFDTVIPPGENYDKAEFRLWLPDEPGALKGVLVAVTGSNMDSRSWVTQSGWRDEANKRDLKVRSSYWQDIARRHSLALLGCNFTDRRHEDMFIEEYANAGNGSGQALLDALVDFAEQSGHSELEAAPLAFWGMSAGGQFNYEFACWKPERTITFVLNKGGIYYTALAPAATRKVPGILFIGEKDSPFRTRIVDGIFSMNRRADAVWTLVVEPGAVHEVGRSLEFAELYFDEVIPLRLSPEPCGDLQPLKLGEGYLGSLDTKTYALYDLERAKMGPASWLPTEKTAKAWHAVVTGKTL
ncbi:hypothetical protein JXL21_06815 [Candidatus Bathyarchaeota archaeon]|nr:hypothetical protein [Candidatus Bathyarchaeota archaeon]